MGTLRAEVRRCDRPYDLYQNNRSDHVLAVEHDASRCVFDLIKTDRSSPAR